MTSQNYPLTVEALSIRYKQISRVSIAEALSIFKRYQARCSDVLFQKEFLIIAIARALDEAHTQGHYSLSNIRD